MTLTTSPHASAQEVARQAAARAGVSCRAAEGVVDIRAAIELFAQVWPQLDGHPPVTAELALVIAHGGGLSSLASRDGRVVGGTFGFLARDREGLHLHSHLAGVAPGTESRGIGLALKLHQRAWALGQGLSRISWTYDPLITRNAYFNLTKLGAVVADYRVDFYGPLTDAVNGGVDSDRCVVQWELTSPGVAAAVAGAVEPGAPVGTVVLQVGPDDEPVRAEPDERDVRLLQLPTDALGLRGRRPDLATAWRQAVRDTWLAALDAGFSLTSATRDGWQVLTR